MSDVIVVPLTVQTTTFISLAASTDVTKNLSVSNLQHLGSLLVTPGAQQVVFSVHNVNTFPDIVHTLAFTKEYDVQHK